MPADPETSRILGEVTSALGNVASNMERLERRIDTAENERKDEARRVYDRIEVHSQDSSKAIARVEEKITTQTTILAQHIHHDDERFIRVEKSVTDLKVSSEKEDSKMWSMIMKMLGWMGLGGAGYFIGRGGPDL